MHRYILRIFLSILLPLGAGIDCYGSLKIHSVNGGNYSWLLDQSINCMAQDSEGYLWISTYGGILRYDGADFVLMSHNPNDPASLSDNTVREIKPDPYRGGIWVCTGNGLEYFNSASGKFRHATYVDSDNNINVIKGRVNDVLILPDKVICCGSSRTYVCETDEESLLFRKVDLGFVPLSISSFDEGRFIAANHDGLYVVSTDLMKIDSFMEFQSSEYSSSSVYFSKLTDRIYLGNGIGTKSAVFRYDGSVLVKDKSFVPDNLQRVCDSNGKTFFGTNGSGLYILENGNVTRITRSDGLTSDVVTAFCHDALNNLWIGLYRGGMMLNQRHMESFTVYDEFKFVSSIILADDIIYIGTDSYGLGIYDSHKETSRILNTSNSAIPGDNILSMSRSGDEIWMAIYTKGLCSYNTVRGDFKTYSLEDHNELYVDNNKTWVVKHDKNDRIWVGGPSLFVFSSDSEKFTKIQGLGSKFISAISFFGDIAYVSTRHGGIYKIDINTYEIIDSYNSNSIEGFPENDVRYIYVDSRGKLWFGTQTLGFYSLDESDESLTRYDEKDGLLNEIVTVINEDEEGNIWIGTLNGLHFYSSATGQFIHLGSEDILPGQYLYSAGSYDGVRMYFGSTDGLVFFEPDKMDFKRSSDKIVSFTNITTLSSTPFVKDFFSSDPTPVELKRHDNFFRISFSVPIYIFHKSIRYSYRMVGLEKNWRDIGNLNTITFTALKPGDYQLEVRYSYMSDQWSAPSSLKITIPPQWYATWWAKSLWFILAIASLILFIILYFRQQKINEEKRITEIEKKSINEVTEAKIDFFTQIIHDIRTPIFLIRTQIEVLTEKSETLVKVPKVYLDSILRNSIKLTSLVNRLIDFRKIGSDTLGLRLRTSDVVSFCKKLEIDYIELCSKKNIEFVCNYPDSQLILTFDSEKLESILNNLISNAFKYTNEGGKVVLEIKEIQDAVSFSIKDNGIGITPQNLDKIFDVFVRAERGIRQTGGDGIGLAVVKSFVELHGGRVSVTSTVDEGSDFTFFIPYGLKPDESISPIIEDITDEHSQQVKSQVSVSNPVALNTVLIIDDDVETLNLIERSLEDSYDVLKAANGEDGLRLTQEMHPDIVICDLDMPGYSGHDFLAGIKNDKKLNDVKVIILTGNNSEDEMIRTYEENADAYFTKPVSLKLLKIRIAKMILHKETVSVVKDNSDTNRNYTKEEQLFLLKCREIIDEHLCETEFNMDYLAEKLAMCHSSLYKKIKSITGKSLIGFVNDYKIHRAVLMFRQGEFNVSSVCEHCGFKDEKNFRELFKRKTGMTPKQFIKNLT